MIMATDGTTMVVEGTTMVVKLMATMIMAQPDGSSCWLLMMFVNDGK